MMQMIKKLVYGLMAFTISLFSGTANLYALSLSDVPLFVGNTEIPNVFFVMDDSGSMDWEVLTQPHWHYCAYDSNDVVTPGNNDCGWLVDNGLLGSYTGSGYEYFNYMYSEADNAYSVTCDGSTDRQSYESCSPSTTAIDADWRVRSSSVNVIYYNPDIEYAPWQGPDGTTDGSGAENPMQDAAFTAARSNPHADTAGYSSTRDLTGFIYEVWLDDHGYTVATGRPRRGTNLNSTSTANNEVDLWDTHYRVTVNGASITVEQISYMPGVGGLNPTTTVIASTVPIWAKVVGENSSSNTRSVAEVQQNIANWYQYSRRRAFVAKAATASVIKGNAGLRYGLSVFDDHTSLFKELPDGLVTDFSTHNDELLNLFFGFSWPDSGTYLRTGLERVGEYYAGNLTGKTSPIVSECQQNFSVLVSDGYWDGSDPSSSIGNADGDGYSLTAADVAKYYYDTDLRSDLDNSVPTTDFDLNTQQHMVTFTVAFGVDGLLEDTDNDGWPNPALSGSGNWGDPSGNSIIPEKIDDLWHAAFNSKGAFISAKSPLAVVEGLDDALGDVADRTSSASAIAANSTTLNSGTALYQALFASGNWAGDLRKLLVSDGNASSGVCLNVQRGFVCPTPLWSAKDQLAGQDYSSGREIISYNPTEGTGIVFSFPSNYGAITGGSSDSTKMDANQITALLFNSLHSDSGVTANQTFGDDLVDFLRGDSSNEGTGQYFRVRNAKLGDVINSAPVFVGAPRFRYSDSIESVPYSTFKTNNQSRAEMVYVGGNDGMLHGFDAATGNEELAFLPSAVYDNLHELAESSYNHSYFVDGSPSVGDAFFASNSTWRSVLVGGLNGGGKSVYALDVTTPTNFDESNADDLVLWEFFDADLGYTYGTPDVVKMANGDWAAIFGNGYNNTGTGQAGIYIVNIETGVLIKKILTGTDVGGILDSTTPNGIGHITPVDANGDGAVDYIYGGDLRGNLWKFDVSNSNTSKWGVAYTSGNGGSAVSAPIFTATSPTNGNPQPITSRPTVTKHPDGSRDGFMVYFGTGKYLETTDNLVTGQDTQTFYGIWDVDDSRLTAINKSNDLLQQVISFEDGIEFDLDGDSVTDLTREVRITTSNPIDWDSHLGWYMDLINTETGSTNLGERQVTNPIVRNGRIIFTTLQPAQTTCSFGGSSWLMELDAESGSRLPTPPFDLNNDGFLDDDDAYVASGGTLTPPGGVRFDGIITMPRILGGGDQDFKNFGNTSSQSISTIGEESGENLGRASWRQIIR